MALAKHTAWLIIATALKFRSLAMSIIAAVTTKLPASATTATLTSARSVKEGNISH